jgi:hypothetical protein
VPNQAQIINFIERKKNRFYGQLIVHRLQSLEVTSCSLSIGYMGLGGKHIQITNSIVRKINILGA